MEPIFIFYIGLVFVAAIWAIVANVTTRIMDGLFGPPPHIDKLARLIHISSGVHPDMIAKSNLTPEERAKIRQQYMEAAVKGTQAYVTETYPE